MAIFAPCKARTPGLVEKDQVIKDFTRSNKYLAARVYTPSNKQQLVAAILEGESLNKKVKAQGSCYSFTAAQNADDYLIKTDSLNMHLSQPHPPRRWVSDELVRLPEDRIRKGFDSTRLFPLIRPEVPLKEGTYLIHVEAGIKIKRLLKDLRDSGLGLPTMGSGGGQSLAGAISTGTHGSDFNIPPLSDFVRAIHLVGPGGREWWIEPSLGVVGGPGLTSLPEWCDSTSIIRDEEFFRAALVSLGRLGVIYSIVLQVRDQYWLEERAVAMTDRDAPRWSGGEPREKNLRDRLKLSIEKGYKSSGGVMNAPLEGVAVHNYSVTIDLASGQNCWVVRRWETKDRKEVLEPSSDTWMCDDPKDLAGAVFAMKGVFTALEARALAFPGVGIVWAARIMGFWGELMALADDFDTIGDFVLSAAAKATELKEIEVGPDALREIWNIVKGIATLVLSGAHKEQKRGPSETILDQHDYDVDHCYNGNSMELFFDANDTAYLRFVDDVIQAAQDRGLVPGYISLRFVRRSEALLAMERFDLTVAIEIAVPRRTDGTDLYKDYVDKVLGLVKKHGGIPHWGQVHKLTAGDVEKIYGSSLEAFRWAIAEVQMDAGPATFSNQFSVARGLEKEKDKSLAHYRSERSGGVLVSSMVPLLCV